MVQFCKASVKTNVAIIILNMYVVLDFVKINAKFNKIIIKIRKNYLCDPKLQPLYMKKQNNTNLIDGLLNE